MVRPGGIINANRIGETDSDNLFATTNVFLGQFFADDLLVASNLYWRACGVCPCDGHVFGGFDTMTGNIELSPGIFSRLTVRVPG